MIATTKLYNKFQTVVPVEIRKKLNVSIDDVVEWELTEDGGVKVKFRKKTTLNDISGIIKDDLPYNAVELKKMAF
jgi:bifunctional DNA-binding transcriptional regulator/antitoxin component of YhaV-PrlF toxin-antitoxin module